MGKLLITLLIRTNILLDIRFAFHVANFDSTFLGTGSQASLYINPKWKAKVMLMKLCDRATDVSTELYTTFIFLPP